MKDSVQNKLSLKKTNIDRLPSSYLDNAIRYTLKLTAPPFRFTTNACAQPLACLQFTNENGGGGGGGGGGVTTSRYQ